MAAMSTLLVTGAAGFIGFHLCQALLARGHQICGVDNLTPYYDPALKRARLEQLQARDGFEFRAMDLADRATTLALFSEQRFERVVHLAAQAGVRYSMEQPLAYVDSNLLGFAHVLEGCRQQGVRHLMYASSSSVYGQDTRLPWSASRSADHPISVYAATKKSNELMAHAYAHLYGLSCTGLRFFTVYGPWGRPDMAYYKFARAIADDRPIEVYNHGRMQRDFTYIDDVVQALLALLDRPAAPNPHWSGHAPDAASSTAPYRLYNIGHHGPVALGDFIALLEQLLGRRARRIELPMQPGDVPATYADIDDLVRDVGFGPATPLEVGLERFVRWFRDYHRVD